MDKMEQPTQAVVAVVVELISILLLAEQVDRE
jgi:hypothetical protein